MTSGDLSKVLLTQLLMLKWSMLKFLSLFEQKRMEWYSVKPGVVMNTPQTCCYCCSVTQLCPTFFDLMDCSTQDFLCPSLSLRVCSNSCPLSWWCHPTISSSVAPFSSCPQSFLASGSFPMSRLFVSGGQNVGASASASVLPMNIQGLVRYPCCSRDSQKSSPALHSSKASILQHSAFFMVQLSHPYMTIEKTMALTR